MPRWWEELLHVTTGRSRSHDHLPDLRGLPSRRVAVERTHFLVNDRERHDQEHRLYVLRRETSRRDPFGVVVVSNGRGVGYLPDRVAGELAPLLDELGGAALVNGAGAQHGSIRLRVDLPEAEALRVFVASRDGVRSAETQPGG